MNAERRFCPFCGRPVSPEWQHCVACGGALATVIASGNEPSKAMTPTVTESPAPRDERRWNEALLRLKLGELEAAGKLLSDIVLATPRDARALALLGAVRLRQHRIEEAQAYLDKAVLMAPDSPFVRLKLAEYWLALGVPSRALAELDEAEAAANDDVDLVIQVRAAARKIRAGTSGTILLQPPELPGIFKRRHAGASAG
jgi:predicted Zn-dependent protease